MGDVVPVASDDPRLVKILCYPTADVAEAAARREELLSLGVTKLSFEGRSALNGVKVLGKGCVSVVVVAFRGLEKCALKVRRVDADRSSMGREARFLSYANKLGVGPRLIAYSRNFLVMEYVEGLLIDEWASRANPEELKNLLLNLLSQCYKMDEAGLDHGELSNAKKHVVVDLTGKPRILDFESSSLTRKPSNVTSICQYLLLRGPSARRFTEALGLGREELVEVLRAYKRSKSPNRFTVLLKALNLA